MKRGTLTYSGYGLNVEAAFPLPELPPSEGKADVLIRREDLGTPPVRFLRDGYYFGRTPDEIILAWGDLVAVSVRGGREMGYDSSPQAGEYWLRQCLLGPAFGVLLHQRGLLVLHASAVEMDGEAVIIMGQKGMGKSTTAAALHMRGHRLLADDIVALELSAAERPRIRPGFRHVKLRQDAAEVVCLADREPLEPQLELEKHTWPVSSSTYQDDSVPLRQVYVLDDGETLRSDELSAVKAFAELVTHSYALRFIGRSGYTESHLAAIAGIVPLVTTCRLTRKASLDRLSDLVDLIERRCVDA